MKEGVGSGPRHDLAESSFFRWQVAVGVGARRCRDQGESPDASPMRPYPTRRIHLDVVGEGMSLKGSWRPDDQQGFFGPQPTGRLMFSQFEGFCLPLVLPGGLTSRVV